MNTSQTQIETVPARKCARHGCVKPKYEEYDFCFDCLVTGRAMTSTTCDNLPSITDDHETH